MDRVKLAEYAASLEDTGRAYAIASEAVGMDRNKGRREAAEYLRSEGERLTRESVAWYNYIDEQLARMPKPL